MTQSETERMDVRMQVLLSDPALLDAVAGGGAFGGAYSAAVAQNMYDPNHAEAIDDAKRLVTITEVASRSWLVQLPIVNCVVFETDDGLVVVDTGMAPGGPAILQAIRTVTAAPVHTIIYTHAHVDHCMGTWALIDDDPEIIAHGAASVRFDRYVRLRGSVSRYLSQPLATFPEADDDWVAPTRTFAGERLSITVGGEAFDLVHRRGETDDQLYVSVPGRRAIASADYVQPFLPNAGNGKRVQRYVEEWVVALREMIALDPLYLLPAHGDPSDDPAGIVGLLSVHADVLEYIVDHTLRGLNERQRQDVVADSLQLPDALADHPALREAYVSPADISRMVIKQYCGWWDDIPSHWSPARFDEQAAAVCEVAGGVDAIVERARELATTNPTMACHLIDWAWYCDQTNMDTAAAVLDTYRTRIVEASRNTQEVLMYLDHMTDVQLAINAAGGA